MHSAWKGNICNLRSTSEKKLNTALSHDRCFVVGGLYLVMLLAQGCATFDPFWVSSQTPEAPQDFSRFQEATALPGPVTGSVYLDMPCGRRASSSGEWSVSDVIRSALCRDPRSRRSWAEIVSASARLGSQYAEFLPSLSSTSAIEEGRSQRSIAKQRSLDVDDHLSVKQTNVGLTWVLFDGGVRVARASAAEDYLLAQRASHSQALLTVFIDAAQMYFRVVAIQATADAKREAENAAQNVYRVSAGRHQGGIAPLSDVLQAETAFRQATLDRMQSEGDLQVARGQLATLIGMSANITVPLRPPKLFAPAADDIGEIDALIQRTERLHPSIVAAAAQLSAKKAESKASAMSQLPTISFTTDLSGSIREGDPSLPLKTQYIEQTVGIQIKIPLSFVASSYARREALANVAAARADLDNVELKVALDVWTAYQKLKTDVDRYYVTSKLVSASEHSYAIASGRYQHGIGGILEVLNAQAALANARQEKIEVQSSYCSDRLVLSANLGKLDIPKESE